MGAFTTRKARSPTGGERCYFKSPGCKIGNRGGFAHGIDFRGDGGYIVVAPSQRSEGVYAWTNDSDIAPCPEWLLNLIETKKSVEVKATASDADKIVAGGRNTYLASLAGSMRNKGAVPEAIHAALIAQNQTKCGPPCRMKRWQPSPTAFQSTRRQGR